MPLAKILGTHGACCSPGLGARMQSVKQYSRHRWAQAWPECVRRGKSGWYHADHLFSPLQNSLWVWLCVDPFSSSLLFSSWLYSFAYSLSPLATGTFPMKEKSRPDSCFNSFPGSRRELCCPYGWLGTFSYSAFFFFGLCFPEQSWTWFLDAF